MDKRKQVHIDINNSNCQVRNGIIQRNKKIAKDSKNCANFKFVE